MNRMYLEKQMITTSSMLVRLYRKYITKIKYCLNRSNSVSNGWNPILTIVSHWTNDIGNHINQPEINLVLNEPNLKLTKSKLR